MHSFVYGLVGSCFFAQKEGQAISKTIYIRNVDPGVLAKIDELAKQKGISRNKIVNIILENYVFTDKIKATENKYSELVESTTNAINNFTVALHQLQQKVTQPPNSEIREEKTNEV